MSDGGQAETLAEVLASVPGWLSPAEAWALCELAGWPDNDRFRNLAAWRWAGSDRRHLIVVNLSGTPSQGRVRLPGLALAGRTWRMGDLMSGDVFERSGDEMTEPGLYVDLPPWGFHFFEF